MPPLAGMRIVEFCEVAAGPFCGMLLSDLGADVIKVERPDTGDAMRQWPPITAGMSENFASLNRNKRSVALDLKDARMLEAAKALALSADAVIESYRPGVMAKLGLDASSLLRNKPALVYCSISAFGQTGPRAAQGGFDLTIQAMSGVMSVTGEPGGPPVKCGVPLADFVTGLYAALYVVACLHSASRSGHGRRLDVPMIATTLAVAALQTSELFGTGRDPRPLGSAHPRNAPYRAFKARDGDFVLAAGNDRLWSLVTKTIGRPDLLERPEFRTTSLRAEHQELLREILEDVFRSYSVAELVEAFTQQGVPCSSINTYSEALDDPQVRHLSLVQPIDLPGGVRSRTVSCPVRIDGEQTLVRTGPPRLGEHTGEVLRELGLDIGSTA